MMTQVEALVSLNTVWEIGSIRLKKLLEYFDKPENILRAPEEKLMAVSGIGEKIAHKIASLKKEDLDKEFASVKKLGLKIMIQNDPDYPRNLKYMYDPPIVLYVKGEIKSEDNLSIAIVGSRRASFYGLSCAEKFAGELSNKGFTIVSGMARGIDSYAHRGALKAGGRTVAVMGSGFNQIYPPENEELAEEIAQNGAVISEFSLDMPPKKENFPCRNRLISGLSLGVLVVEAARNSGALITADFALEQGREVFALPGKVDSDTSFGTNKLIKEGAKLVSSCDDILEEFMLPASNVSQDKEAKAELKSVLPDREESQLYDLISGQSINLDELIGKTNLDIASISDILLRLQMKKLIRQLPGKQFVRSV
ncbi:MAG: DNA-processing protein DprA [Candidatus Omnitrophica bacterium]|nr:DNA-processing protein DprA [Candidatus Omnitrophota bacterium]MDD5238401.1 DNA-processing protein DprA [Candidatus Omnitrophota bacterium]